MKTCSYCGKQYPDDVTACPIDQEPLTKPVKRIEGRAKLTGVWRGAYGYEDENRFGEKVVSFTLKLRQGWFGHFTGTVTEDAPVGTPGCGAIDGYFDWPTIEFTKQMPVGYVTKPDGTKITLREHFIEHGFPCERELPSSPISYEGKFLDTNRVQGAWIIRPQSISFSDRRSVTLPETAGIWCAEFITSDTEAVFNGGPKRPFFDRASLPKLDVSLKEGAAFHKLGKFRVAEAERILRRFKVEKVRYEISRDDEAIRTMSPVAAALLGGYSGNAPMIEIFVHRDDEAKATAIVNEGNSL